MAITLLYACCQVETSARDFTEARDVLIGVLGGGPIEQTLARQMSELIPGGQYDVDHIDGGEAVFQNNQPSPAMTYNGRKSVPQAYLDRVGASDQLQLFRRQQRTRAGIVHLAGHAPPHRLQHLAHK